MRVSILRTESEPKAGVNGRASLLKRDRCDRNISVLLRLELAAELQPESNLGTAGQSDCDMIDSATHCCVCRTSIVPERPRREHNCAKYSGNSLTEISAFL